ncbi:MAG: TatD family hydrolase [Gemmatimonadota bacterium]
MLVDTHCHLGADQFSADLPEVLERAWSGGLAHLVVIGESRSSAEKAIVLGGTDARIWATAGIHPHDASQWNPGIAAWLSTTLQHPRIVAAGEMGLDYHYDHSPRSTQRQVFEAQLQLAATAGKPAVIHAREADDDVAAILRAHAGPPVILHSYSSGPSLLAAGLGVDAYFSFSGMITFKNWKLDDAIRSVPLNRILIETDSPYLAPTPYRGRRNEPAFVGRVAEQIALVRGLDPDEVVHATGGNAARIFHLDP